MARVSDQTIINAWIRQEGVCAECGESLKDTAYEAHHMKRVKDGGNDSDDNIVLLCDRDEHEFFHGDNTKEPIETSLDQYPFFYGKSSNLEYKDEQIDRNPKEIEDIDEQVKDDESDKIDDDITDAGGVA